MINEDASREWLQRVLGNKRIYMCHFTKMEHCGGDCDDNGNYEEWFECKHCGCCRDVNGRKID